jgi:O-antigen ligase
MNASPLITKEKHNLFQKATLIAICVYALSLYVGYVNSTLLRLQGLSLYAMVGLLLFAVLQKGYVRINSYLIWYGAFIVAAIISCLYSADRSNSFSALYGLVIVWIFAFALNTVVAERKHIEVFFVALIIGSAVLTVYLMATGQFESFDDTGSRFGEALTGNANIFASIYMIAAAVTAYFLFKQKSLRAKLPFIAALALQLYALTMSGGRKYFLFPFILLYVIAIQRKDRRQRTHFIRVSIISVLFAVMVYQLLMNNEFFYTSIGYRFEDLIEYTIGQSSEVEGGTIIREQMIAKGLELWRESPVFGHGLDAFASIGGFGVYAHNNYVEMLCNHGIFGFVFYYGFYLYMLYKLLKRKENDIMRQFLIGFILCLFVYDFGAISYDTLVTQFFLIFASVYMSFRSTGSVSEAVISNESEEAQNA